MLHDSHISGLPLFILPNDGIDLGTFTNCRKERCVKKLPGITESILTCNGIDEHEIVFSYYAELKNDVLVTAN